MSRSRKEREELHFHVDMDAFYASVEQADNPELKGKPVIIGASPGKRGVVSACSYEARRYGVHSAMPISEAYRRCPAGHYLPVRMKRYQELSSRIMALFTRFTPEIRQISVDEAFLNMTGTERLFGSPETSGAAIKALVRESTDLTISIGIAPNRFLAKLASEVDKPDGLYRIKPGDEIQFIDTLELKDLWGLGKKSVERLRELNIRDVKTLRSYREETLKRLLGEHSGSYLFQVVRGIDPGLFREETKSKSVSNETTFSKDTRDYEVVRKTLLELSDQVLFRVLSSGEQGNTVFLKIRFSDFSTTTVQKTVPTSPGSTEELYFIALSLLEQRWKGAEELRLIGVGISGLKKGQSKQGELFQDQWDRKRLVEEAVLKLRTRGNTITKASLLPSEKEQSGKARSDDQENR
jgi:DNA polymerase IV